MIEHGYPSSFVYSTYKSWSLAPEMDNFLFILRHIHVIILALEKQKILHVLSVCLLP